MKNIMMVSIMKNIDNLTLILHPKKNGYKGKGLQTSLCG